MNRWMHLLEWICPPSLYEGIEGDILEQYESDKTIFGLRKAKRRLALNVIGFMRPGILLRNHFLSELNKWMMLQNNLRIAFRYLMKSKTFSGINITGLAVGIAAFLLIVHYVRYEYSYEDFHTKSKNIYRVTLDVYKGSEFVVSDCEMYAPIGPLLTDRYPEVLDYVRFYEFSNQEVKSGDHRFFESKIGLVDPSILSVFSFHLVKGNAATALKAPFEAVITESMAKKYFVNMDALGQVLEIRNQTYKVTGVIADPPLSTHLKVNLLLSHSTLPQMWNYKETEFQGNNEYTYLLMNDKTNLDIFNAKLKALSIELKEQIGDDRLIAEPMKGIHLYSTKSYEPETPGNYRVVDFLLLISIFILFIAWINYINLSTARAVERAREVGIRKVLGSIRIQLIFQFLSESTIITLLASVVALLIVYVSLPFFISLTGLPLTLSIFQLKEIWYLTGGIMICGSLLAGLYPAFVLSSFQPVSVLKGKFQSSAHGQWLRKGLVVFQFASAVVLIVCLTTVYMQINHLQKQNLGMSIEQTLGVRSPVISDSIYLSRSRSFVNVLRSESNVKEVARSGGALPGMSMQELSSTGNVYRPGQQDADRGFIYYVNSFDEDFIRLFDMKLVAGRNFKKDDLDLIINEEAMRLLGFKNAEEAVGSKVFFYDNEKTIVGVLRNFHQRSPKEKH
ncbi:MAG TPA: ABC transporter permease, partial [Cyclobacteriaceae bacterium]